MAEGTNWEEEPTSSVRSKTDTGPNSTIINFFTKCEDYQLFLLTQFYWDELEQAVEKGVDELSSLLTDQRVFSGQEHRQIINLEEKGDISESCKLLLSLVMEKGSGARLVMWESFVKMRHGVPKLDKMLKEIQEHGPDPLDSMRMCRSKSKAPSQLKDWKIESATAVAKKASGMKAGKCRRIHSSDLDTFDFITKEVVQQKHKQTLWVQTETLRVNTIQIKDKVKIFQLVDRYAELTIHSIVRDRTLGEHELLASGRDNEQWRETHLLRKELETIQTDQLFQDSFCERMAKRFRKISGSSAAVSGIPGIGKTTMVQKIVYDWATGKIYPHFQFVFSFKFRDLNTIDCRINLRNLILIFYPYFGNVVKELWKNPEGLLFIFDGLDEFKDRIDFSDNRRITEPQSMCTDPECWCEVSDIVYSLIQHKLLPGCSVLVTSRPTALHLLEKAEISVWAEILGFVGDERKEYFNRFFEDQAVASAVCNHLEENEILYTMCYNPSYCLMLGLSLGPFFTQRDRKQQEVPKTITQLYSYYIYNILKNHGREIENPRDVLLKLGEIAFTGISEKKSVFGNGDLIEYNLQPSQFLSGYLMEILERDVSLQSGVYTFPHLTIQQFIAALAQFLTPDPADIRKLLTEAHSKNDGQFELFLHFVFGLSSPEAAQPLEELLGQFLHQTTYQVFDWVKERFIGSIGNRVNETEKRNLLNTFQYVIESQNEALTQATMGSERTLTLCGLRLTPINCTVLSHVIGLCDKIRHLDLEYCYIQFEGLQRLVSILHKCRELRLKKNNLGDPGVKLLCVALRNPDCKIQDIGLEENELTDSCVEDLASVLITNVSLTDLKLGYNRLGDSGVKQLTMALMNPNCKIKTLGLEENRLTDHCAGDLASTLSTNRSLTDLKLGFNRLGDSGVKILCVALRNPDCKLQTLWLYRNDITVYSAKDLFATLNTNQSLEILNLNQNDLGGLGVKLLSEFLRKPECKIRKLGLSAVGLTDSYVEDLASALSTNQLLTDLNLGYNKVGDAGVKLLSVALKNQNCTIQELGLNNNSLTDSCTEDLSSALSRNRSVRVLDLKSNSFTDRSVPALRYLILTCRSLKSIRLCENKFRSKGKRHLELMWGSRPGMSVTL